MITQEFYTATYYPPDAQSPHHRMIFQYPEGIDRAIALDSKEHKDLIQTLSKVKQGVITFTLETQGTTMLRSLDDVSPLHS